MPVARPHRFAVSGGLARPLTERAFFRRTVGFAQARRVVGVSDGDTITVLRKGKGERIRLHGIDCPEKRQAFGNRAKQFTSKLVFGTTVTVQVVDRDRYGRTVAEVLLPDGRSLNRELVRAGFAWWYWRYTPDDETLAQLEREARGAKRGLWADPHACAAVGMANHEEAVLVSQGNATNYPPPQAVANADAAGAG